MPRFLKGAAMSDRVYLLLNVAEGKADQVAGRLRHLAGVRMVDLIEGQADVIAVVEAPERHELAKLTVQALSSVETVIEDLQLLPARNGPGSLNSI